MKKKEGNVVIIKGYATTILLLGILLAQAGCSENQVAMHGRGGLQAFERQVTAAIHSETRYPWEAAEAKIQGTTVVSFDYYGGGKAANIRVFRSSGDSFLDAAAIDTVNDADLPPLPKIKLPPNHYHFLVPIVFALPAH